MGRRPYERILGQEDEAVEDLGLEVFAVLEDASMLDGYLTGVGGGGGGRGRCVFAL